MFPLYDESAPSISPPYIVFALIGINVFVFIFTIFSISPEGTLSTFGVIPYNILEGKRLFTLITSLFLHAGVFHLIGNMWFLWIFGDNVEFNFGPLRFLAFYLLVGVIASLIHVFMASSKDMYMPMVGASGAISGVIGAYVVLYPYNKIKTLIFLFYRAFVYDIPAFFFVGVWFLYQLLYMGVSTSVAYMAHIGGFLTGMLFCLLFRRKVIRKDYRA
ncbi:rhomboid family intramembrane serine protease [bacterium]|nr:rhomboid family intramembrane serine protease [bacterium]